MVLETEVFLYFPIILVNLTESAVFKDCRLSIFLNHLLSYNYLNVHAVEISSPCLV